MPVVLALLYVLCHGLVLALWPGPAGVGSFVFLTGAPLLAAAACLAAPPRPRGTGVARHGIGAAAVGRRHGVQHDRRPGRRACRFHPRASLFLYVLYGVPLVFILARARRERVSISLIDAAMAALLGVLFFVHAQSFAARVDIDDHALSNMQRMFDIQNLCIAVFAVVRWLAGDVPERRTFSARWRCMRRPTCWWRITSTTTPPVMRSVPMPIC